MSMLSDFLRDEIRRAGITQTDLAAESGIPKSTMSRLMNDQVDEPELSTLARLSEALNVPLIRLIELAGFPVGDVSSLTDQQRRLSSMIMAFPWIAPIVDQIAALSLEDREGILIYLETLARRRKLTEERIH